MKSRRYPAMESFLSERRVLTGVRAFPKRSVDVRGSRYRLSVDARVWTRANNLAVFQLFTPLPKIVFLHLPPPEESVPFGVP